MSNFMPIDQQYRVYIAYLQVTLACNIPLAEAASMWRDYIDTAGHLHDDFNIVDRMIGAVT